MSTLTSIETSEDRQAGPRACLCAKDAAPASPAEEIATLEARRAAVEERLHDLEPVSTADQEV